MDSENAVKSAMSSPTHIVDKHLVSEGTVRYIVTCFWSLLLRYMFGELKNKVQIYNRTQN